MKWNDLAITAPNREPHARKRLDLVGPATGAELKTTVTGASTLTVNLPDTLLTAGLAEATDATAAGRGWALVALRRRGDHIALVYEDRLVAALRAHTDPIMWQVAITLGDVVGRFCGEADVPATVDPVLALAVVEGAGRSRLEETDSWREIGALVNRAGGRVFSTGEELVVSTDAGLLARPEAPVVREARGAVQGDIHFTLDVAQPLERAWFTVDTAWTAEAGTTVELRGAGPADGRWLVAEWTRPLAAPGIGTVRLTRPRTLGL